ncbi:MAG: aldo/keto reductase [Anaerolineae bacterium]|nr:aldo/keto reductase [Anaerolineae bacterium]
MEYRLLGRTGVKVSSFCLGTMNFGGRTDEKEATAIINHAIESGINFIDTANVYGHDPANFEVGRGRSEEIIGRALKQNGKRPQIVLATKAHFPMSSDPNAQGNSRRHIIEQCEASLRRLQTDAIDLYQLHHPTNDVPIDETLRALDDLIHAGKVRYIGTSSFAAWQMVESLWVSKEWGFNRFVCEQPVYNLLDRRVERELIPMAQTYGLAIIPWSPMAGGLLTGAYRRGQTPPTGSRYDTFWKRPDYLTDTVFDVLDVVETVAKEKTATPAQIALRWCMDQPGVTSPIIGPRTLNQLENNLGALEFSLTEEDHKRLDAIAPPGQMTVPFYGNDGFAWTTWGPHRYR